jgi:hypothetical protein
LLVPALERISLARSISPEGGLGVKRTNNKITNGIETAIAEKISTSLQLFLM